MENQKETSKFSNTYLNLQSNLVSQTSPTIVNSVSSTGIFDGVWYLLKGLGVKYDHPDWDTYNINPWDDGSLYGSSYYHVHMSSTNVGKDYKSSLEYFEIAERIRNVADKPNLCYSLVEKSEVFLKQHLYVEAIKTIKLGLSGAELYKNAMLDINSDKVHKFHRLCYDKENIQL